MNALSLDRLAEVSVAQLWQVTALAMVVWVVTRLCCRHRPHLAYLLWMLVLVKCLTPPIAASRLSPFSWAMAARVERVAVEKDAPKPTLLAAVTLAPDEHPANPEAITVVPKPIIASTTTDLHWYVVAGALTIWALGSLALALIVVAKWIALRRVVRTSQASSAAIATQLASIASRLNLRRPVRIVVTDEPLGPLVFGVLRPTIVLPAAALQSTDGQSSADLDLEPVLAHELVHVRRGDTAASVLQTAAQVTWWFHPLVWWANREVRRQRERACDEEVVAGLECSPTRYARSLLAALEAAPHRRSAWAAAGVPMLSFTGQRLAHLVRKSARFNRRTPLGYWIVAAALLAMLLPGAGLSLEAPLEANGNADAAADNPAEPEPGTTLTQATIQIDGVVTEAVPLEDPEITGQVTGHFTANPQVPVPANEVGSDAQRAAVTAIEKLGGSRDKSGKVQMTIIVEANKWKGGAAGLANLKAIEDLHGLYVACQSLPADGLAPLNELQELTNLQLDSPSLEQLQSLNDWRGPKVLTVYGEKLNDESLGEIAHWLNLESLTIAGDGSQAKPPQAGITDAGIDSLKSLVHLKRLQISSCPQVSGGTLGALSGLSDLRMVMLLQGGFDDRGVAELAKLSQLKHVILDGTKITSAGYAPLGKMTSLSRLSLNEARTFDDAAAAHLASLTKLRALHVFDNKLTDAGLAPLAGLTELRELQAWKGKFSDAGVAHLRGLTKLQILRLDSETLDVGNAGLGSLVDLKDLRQLSLHARRATDEGLAALAGMTALQYLDLQHAQIHGPGLAQLKGLAKLQNLFLMNTPLDDAGLKLLPALAKLKLLNLSNTKLTDEGLGPLAQLPALVDLHLSDTAITDAGLPTLAKIPKLQTLDLSNTKITNAGLEKLVGAKALRVLLISGTQITAEGKKLFKQNHPEVDFEPQWAFSLAVNSFQISDDAEEEARDKAEDAKANGAGDKTESGFQLDND
jgi:beta-lactamase regulating signal transducer with metallopeptidase domain/Leucine-rich repeat (LRR) protein